MATHLTVRVGPFTDGRYDTYPWTLTPWTRSVRVGPFTDGRYDRVTGSEDALAGI